jgi:tetratricopeptide (TPR) repeat protein
LDVSGSSAAEILLDAAVPGISYRIATANGTEIRSGRIATFGWTAIPMAIPSTTSGQRQIQIELKAEKNLEGLSGVRVRTELRSIPSNRLETHEEATRLFNAAQLLHRSLHGDDVRRAITQFERAAHQWALAGDPYGQALALGAKGESEIELSHYMDAKRTLDRALACAGDNAYPRGWLLHLQARVLFDQYEGKQAGEIVEEEMRLGQSLADPALIALARTDKIGVAFWLHDAKMDQVADQAHDEAIAAGVPDALALELRWKGGWVDEYFQRDVSALNALNESDRFFRQAGDWRSTLENTLDEAQAINQIGDTYSALARFVKFDPAVRDSGSDTDYADNLVDIGDQYHQLNNPRLADLFYRRAYAVYARAHLLFGQMVTQNELCEAELVPNLSAKAEPECQLALRIAQEFGDSAYLSEAKCNLGIAERKAGRLAQAFADLTEAARLTHTINDPVYESREHLQLGELLDLQGKHHEALAEFQQAQSLSQGVADPASLLEAQYAVARWYAREGQYGKADAELAPALEKLEAARQLVSNNTLQASYFAAERKCYELAVDLRMRQSERNPAQGADALALEMSERSRARGLLDGLSFRATPGAVRSGEDEVRLIQANMAVDRAFDRRLKLLVEGSAKRDLEASSSGLAQALGDLERAEDEVNADARQAAKPASTMSAAEIERASLSSDVTFFEYELGTERSYLWVIGEGVRKSYVLPPRQRLEEMVKQWEASATSNERGGADAGAKFKRLSRRLSCALFPGGVDARMAKIVIVPDGSLAMLPFAALPGNGCSGASAEPLVVEHEITLTPSLSVFLSRKPVEETYAFQGEVAIVADPVYDAADPRAATLKIGHPNRAAAQETAVALPRLLNAGYEASAIQGTVRKAAGKDQVFLARGFDANIETVLSPAMRNYRIWHLAAHGIYDETTPEFSGLVFSLLGPDGRPRFGFLKAHDISKLDVRADLIVLSACDSAAGEDLGGEGVMGLSYSFLRAGAKQVVSTLWSVDDARSKELMVTFYKELMRNGGNAAAALRRSQLVVMRRPHSYAPYYWAGFELSSVGR